jgi:CubicO group peptidase (beta-lactamase class C family)
MRGYTTALRISQPPYAPMSAGNNARVDAVVAEQMTRRAAPGLVVAVVANGDTRLLRGYGVANLTTRSPVDPENAPLRVGSVSKSVTATAVMQLVEQHRLALDADVNRYLRDLQIPPAFGRPVTAGALLTHTAGFEDRLVGTAAHTPSAVLSLAAFLARDLPACVRLATSTCGPRDVPRGPAWRSCLGAGRPKSRADGHHAASGVG